MLVILFKYNNPVINILVQKCCCMSFFRLNSYPGVDKLKDINKRFIF